MFALILACCKTKNQKKKDFEKNHISLKKDSVSSIPKTKDSLVNTKVELEYLTEKKFINNKCPFWGEKRDLVNIVKKADSINKSLDSCGYRLDNSYEIFLIYSGFELTTHTCGCMRCANYQDVIPNPEVNNQVKKNNNRYHKSKRTRYKNGKKWTYYHNGTDILAKIGTNIHSLLCGKVIHVRTNLPQDHTLKNPKGYESSSSYGNTILVESIDKNGEIIYIFYAHCSTSDVKAGDYVVHGQIIGKSGSTGNAMKINRKNDHSHVEAGTKYMLYPASTKLKSKLTVRVNPETYMKTKFAESGDAILYNSN